MIAQLWACHAKAVGSGGMWWVWKMAACSQMQGWGERFGSKSETVAQLQVCHVKR